MRKGIVVLVFLMCSLISNAQTGVQNIEKKQFVSSNSDSKSLGNINILFPEDGHELTLREDKVFKWASPNNLQSEQEYCCHLRIVKMDELDNPNEAIDNSAYFEYITDTTTFTGNWFAYLDSVHFASGQYFAMQVKAYSSDTLLAESNVHTFKGPKPFEAFYLDGRTIYSEVFTKIDPAWDSLCGYGYTNLVVNNLAKKVPVYFENYNYGASATLQTGVVYGSFSSEFTINPRNVTSVLSTPMYLDSLIITVYDSKIGCKFSPQIIINSDTVSFDYDTWISVNEYNSLEGKFYLNDTVISNDQFIYEIDSTSNIDIYSNYYFPEFYGSVNYTYNNDTFKVAIPDAAKDISYFSSELEDTVHVTGQLDISSTSYTVDCSDTESPGIFQDTIKWQGIYFNDFKINEVKQDSTFVFELTGNTFEAVKRDTSSWLAYLKENKLILDIDTIFNNSISGTYNYFDASYDHIKINNLNDTLVWDVDGTIYINYLYDYRYNITILCKDNAILLAETDINCEFQPFPLYEFELNHFAILLDNDTIPGDIDHANKEIDIILPAFPEGYNMYTFNTFFNILGHNILLDGDRITSGANYGEIDFYESTIYTLKIVSYDNRYITYTLNIELEEFVNTENLTENINIEVYPNPANDFIKVSGVEIGNQLSILDINGRTLHSMKVANQTELINIEEFETGVYFIKIKNSENTLIKKVIKQ